MYQTHECRDTSNDIFHSTYMYVISAQSDIWNIPAVQVLLNQLIITIIIHKKYCPISTFSFINTWILISINTYYYPISVFSTWPLRLVWSLNCFHSFQFNHVSYYKLTNKYSLTYKKTLYTIFNPQSTENHIYTSQKGPIVKHNTTKHDITQRNKYY